MVSRNVSCWTLIGILFLTGAVPAVAQIRSEAHEKYAASLWKLLHPATGPKYVRWAVAAATWICRPARRRAPAKDLSQFARGGGADKLPHGSVVVTEHLAPGGEQTRGDHDSLSLSARL